jgi:2-polyprenyl-3-methyl-5-hydroxy-6-metoxy-1,4-benzoquinol methylase
MDQPGLERAEHWQALRGLGRVNTVSRTASLLWPHIARLARQLLKSAEPIRVLDVATGGGDTPIALGRLALRSRLKIEVHGCDISREAINYAENQPRAPDSPVRFFVLDALTEDLPPGYDIVMCSLFLHHLDEVAAIGLLRRMACSARRLLLVDDLIRSPLGYLIATVGCRLLSTSYIVHHDGPVSVAAAFTPKEILALAKKAGLSGSQITRHWPESFLLSWEVK